MKVKCGLRPHPNPLHKWRGNCCRTKPDVEQYYVDVLVLKVKEYCSLIYLTNVEIYSLLIC